MHGTGFTLDVLHVVEVGLQQRLPRVSRRTCHSNPVRPYSIQAFIVHTGSTCHVALHLIIMRNTECTEHKHNTAAYATDVARGYYNVIARGTDENAATA